jgi:hypothetical protein
MARRRNGFMELAEKLEAGFLAPFIVGVAQSAQGVVKDLQELGPSWSGEFANSWEIASESKVSSGTGASGAPQRLLAPILTPKEYKQKPEVKYYIANKSPHADYALDLREGRFFPPENQPTRNPAAASGKTIRTGSRALSEHKRGDLTGNGEGQATSSAELDWYTTYVRGGKLDKAISLYMDQALRNVRL